MLNSALYCDFCGEKDSMQGIPIKKFFLFTVESVCPVKQLTTGMRNTLKDVRKSQMMPDQMRKWLREQSNTYMLQILTHW
jgi:hypothetical protein